jgi:hypothetical protein
MHVRALRACPPRRSALLSCLTPDRGGSVLHGADGHDWHDPNARPLVWNSRPRVAGKSKKDPAPRNAHNIKERQRRADISNAAKVREFAVGGGGMVLGPAVPAMLAAVAVSNTWRFGGRQKQVALRMAEALHMLAAWPAATVGGGGGGALGVCCSQYLARFGREIEQNAPAPRNGQRVWYSICKGVWCSICKEGRSASNCAAGPIFTALEWVACVPSEPRDKTLTALRSGKRARAHGWPLARSGCQREAEPCVIGCQRRAEPCVWGCGGSSSASLQDLATEVPTTATEDKATVFTRAVKYVRFLRSSITPASLDELDRLFEIQAGDGSQPRRPFMLSSFPRFVAWWVARVATACVWSCPAHGQGCSGVWHVFRV